MLHIYYFILGCEIRALPRLADWNSISDRRTSWCTFIHQYWMMMMMNFFKKTKISVKAVAEAWYSSCFHLSGAWWSWRRFVHYFKIRLTQIFTLGVTSSLKLWWRYCVIIHVDILIDNSSRNHSWAMNWLLLRASRWSERKILQHVLMMVIEGFTTTEKTEKYFR